jgi:hypothetical protein
LCREAASQYAASNTIGFSQRRSTERYHREFLLPDIAY